MRDRKWRERAEGRHRLKHYQAHAYGLVEEAYKTAVPAGGWGVGVNRVEQGNLAGAEPHIVSADIPPAHPWHVCGMVSAQ